MTVAELIEKLKEMPQEVDIVWHEYPRFIQIDLVEFREDANVVALEDRLFISEGTHD